MFFFFFNDTATTEIYTLSLHDALPISELARVVPRKPGEQPAPESEGESESRSEEHTSELQSQSNLVCRLLLEKKKKMTVSAHARSHQCGLPFAPAIKQHKTIIANADTH